MRDVCVCVCVCVCVRVCALVRVRINIQNYLGIPNNGTCRPGIISMAVWHLMRVEARCVNLVNNAIKNSIADTARTLNREYSFHCNFVRSRVDVPLVEVMYLVFYLHACQVRVTVGDTGICCCACVTYFER